MPTPSATWVVFYLRDAKNRVVHEGPTIRECDSLAESMWDRQDRRFDPLSALRLPRALIAVDNYGNDHLVHTYPKEQQ